MNALIAVAVILVVGLGSLAFVYSHQLRRIPAWAKRMMRYAVAAAKDPRLPKPVRWLFVAGLAVKCLPFDGGLDEILLGTGIVLLHTRYRDTWALIRADVVAREVECNHQRVGDAQTSPTPSGPIEEVGHE